MKTPPSDGSDKKTPPSDSGVSHYSGRIVWRGVQAVGMIRESQNETEQLHNRLPALLIFSARLKQAREMRGLSQRQLGELIGLGKATGGVRVNRYEQQTSSADLQTASALAAALQVPLAFLFADSEELAAYILAF